MWRSNRINNFDRFYIEGDVYSGVVKLKSKEAEEQEELIKGIDSSFSDKWSTYRYLTSPE